MRWLRRCWCRSEGAFSDLYQRFELVGLRWVQWQADLEAGFSGFGLDADEAGVLADDALDGVKAET